MSKYEHKPNRGTLFRNENKETDTHPDYSGSALIDGKDYWINAWLEQSEKGTKYFSFSFKAKEERPAQPQAAPVNTDDEGDIPF